MAQTINIKKGLDIQLLGAAKPTTTTAAAAKSFALKPTDFKNLTPKLLLREGADVQAGDAIFCDKDRPNILFCSPVSGSIAEIRRGEKRKILEIIVLADSQIRYRNFGVANPASLTREEVKAKMLASGAWALLVERPYGVVPDPEYVATNIFVTGINSAPLAADVNYISQGQGAHMQAAITALGKLTDGKVFLSLDADVAPNAELKGITGAEIHYFGGAHPKGNAGVQMHALAPLNKGERAYTLTISDLIILGKLFTEGELKMQRTVALAGSEMKDPQYVTLTAGQNLEGVLEEHLKKGDIRIISGNVLTGNAIPFNGFLGFYSSEITAIPNNTNPEFLGWLVPGFDKFSTSRTFFSWLTPNKKYDLDTAMHGEERAFVMTGIYERVFPFDIYPIHLLKACLAGDIEKMEQLGMYEVIEEDFALCEVVCPSKIEIQHIVREALNYMRKELN